MSRDEKKNCAMAYGPSVTWRFTSPEISIINQQAYSFSFLTSIPKHADPLLFKISFIKSYYHFELELDDNLTLDRVDPNLPHIKHNLVIACKDCNAAKGGQEQKK